MAKTAKPKQNIVANSRSRAAKRAASPSIDTDKSLKEVDRAEIGPMLHARQNAGITKKKKAKPMKRGQRARQERGLVKAEMVMDRMEKKVAGAQSREKKRRERRALWEEVNDASKEEQRKMPKLNVLESVEGPGDADWEDESEGGKDGEDTEMKVVDGVKLPANAAAVKMVVVERPASASVAPTDEDEIT